MFSASLEDSVREIDIIAYKASKVLHFTVCTTLVVSCKKSELNVWAFLSREANTNDPNIDYWPLHLWSNDKALQFTFSEQGAGQRYYERAKVLGVKDALAQPSVEVFAFQEMNATSGAPQNDKPIFSAVTSLMKAQAYELGALSGRKKDACIYQFNLISVVDAILARLMFRGNDISASQIDSEHYLARYIVKKRETSARIHFVHANSFESSLADYSRLHSANTTMFREAFDQFYEGILKDKRKVMVLLDAFKERIQHRVDFTASIALGRTVKVQICNLYWRETDNRLIISIESESGVGAALNKNTSNQQTVKESLLEIYKYPGPFEFEDDIPF